MSRTVMCSDRGVSGLYPPSTSLGTSSSPSSSMPESGGAASSLLSTADSGTTMCEVPRNVLMVIFFRCAFSLIRVAWPLGVPLHRDTFEAFDSYFCVDIRQPAMTIVQLTEVTIYSRRTYCVPQIYIVIISHHVMPYPIPYHFILDHRLPYGLLRTTAVRF